MIKLTILLILATGDVSVFTALDVPDLEACNAVGYETTERLNNDSHGFTAAYLCAPIKEAI